MDKLASGQAFGKVFVNSDAGDGNGGVFEAGEVHSGYSTEPVVAGRFFSVAMGMDITFKGMGRMKMDEIAVYEVKDGQIVKEHFFF